MCKKFISLLLSLTILLGAVWVPAGASADPPTPQTVKLTLMPNITGVLGVTSIHNLNESYTLPTSANHPFQKDVPIGKEFVGWGESPTPSSVLSGSYTLTGDTTLYAIWRDIKYTVTFDLNGPSGTNPTSTVTYNGTYTLPATPEYDSKHIFDGWYTAPTGGTRITASTRVTTASDHTLYAHWTEKCTVTFDSDGGTSVQPKTYNKGAAYGSLPSPSKTGFTFDGWYESVSSTTKVQSSDIVDSDKKLIAKWSPRKYTVTLNLDCSDTVTGFDKTSFQIGKDETYAAAGSTELRQTPTRTGYNFMGWYTDRNGQGDKIESNTSKQYGKTTDQILYAHWEANKYTLTFKYAFPTPNAAWKNPDGSAQTTAPTDPSGMTNGATYNSPYPALPTPTPNDIPYYAADSTKKYTFEGWYDLEKDKINPSDPTNNKTGNKVTGGTNGSTYQTDGDQTLYAKWIEAKRVNLVVNGGTLPSGTPAYINVYENGQYNLPTPTWTGCTFQGWYTQENGGTKVSYGDKVPAVDSIPSTLYAQWIPMDVTVTFDPNGSPNHQASTRTYKVGSKYGIGLGALNWSGYKFMGWYTQPTGGEKIEATTVVTVKSSNDLTITLYAHWGYEVSFDPTDGSGSMDPQVAEINQPYTLPVCTFEPPAGMRFGGWAAGTPEASTTYPGGSQYTVNRRVTFYATWTTAPIVITATCTSGGRLTTEDGKTNEVTVERGTDITFVAQANDGYELKELLVDGVNYNYTDVHTFRDVMEDHTIHAVFQRIGAPSYSTCDHGTSCPLNSYSDLNTSEWYHDAIHYCVDNVIMGGTGSSKFYPRRNTTRAELAVSLYNHEGRPPVAGSGLLPNTYSDVKAGEWHYQAIEWATKEGILAGYGNGKFRPNQSVTREQLVAIIWRHAGSPKPRSTTLRFYDAGSVSGYAWEAMCWATEQGILQGRSSGYLVPKGTATRAEVAQMLKNYLN